MTVSEILDGVIFKPTVGDGTLSVRQSMILDSDLHKDPEAAVRVR